MSRPAIVCAVAAQRGEAMAEVGGDGFLFSMPNVSRRTLAEIEDGLIPALQDLRNMVMPN